MTVQPKKKSYLYIFPNINFNVCLQRKISTEYADITFVSK